MLPTSNLVTSFSDDIYIILSFHSSHKIIVTRPVMMIDLLTQYFDINLKLFW